MYEQIVISVIDLPTSKRLVSVLVLDKDRKPNRFILRLMDLILGGTIETAVAYSIKDLNEKFREMETPLSLKRQAG